MKLDKIKFASLIGFLSCRYALTFTQDDMREVDEIIDIEAPLVKASCEDVDELLKCMQQGEKIPAIKAYRTLTGAGLKESKDAVEKYWNVNTKDDGKKELKSDMIKCINEQLAGIVPDKEYVLSTSNNSTAQIKDFINSFY